jgi:hypothetical protein
MEEYMADNAGKKIRGRTKKDDIPVKIKQIEELRSQGMSTMTACETVNLTYKAYLKHRDQYLNAELKNSLSPEVMGIFNQLIAQIKKDAARELLIALENRTVEKPFRSKPLTGD